MSTLCVPSHIPNVADDCEQIHKAFSAAGVVAVADDSLINGGELAVENAAAGFATVTFSHPLDVVRTRFQVNDGRLSNLPTYKNTPHALFTIARSESKTKLFFRGQLIWDAIMDELLAIGMSSAREALLTGCSAGGLATLIHCDAFHDLLPKDTKVKCLADAGFFINEKDVAGKHSIQSFYQNVVQLQGVAKSLNHDCVGPVGKSEPSKCFFPPEFIGSIKTPLFLAQPAYDFWQIANILIPGSADTDNSWLRCKLNILKCNSNQLEVLHGYRDSLLKTLGEFQQNVEGGLFVNSCFIHCQTWATETWHSSTSPRINNKTLAEAVGDWYFKRAAAKHIDCQYPCNPTCYHRDLSLR